MAKRRYLLLLMMAVCGPNAWGATASREPHIGYVCPAGAQRGATCEVVVGGQFIRGVNGVYVSGEGVRASVVQYFRPPRNVNSEQRQALQKRLEEVRDKRLAEMEQQGRKIVIPGRRRPAQQVAKVSDADKAAEAEEVELPDHPMLRNLDDMSLRQLQNVVNTFLDWRTIRKRQPNTQLGEMVLVEVAVDPRATPGDRELRLVTPAGLTNPICFQVGTLPEVCEQEPDDPNKFLYLPKEPPVELPAVLNGQIMPGDADRFRFQAKEGQQLVVETHARHLVPFLADAVPGWFQATVALYDAEGREVAFADDYRFSPDPVLLYEVPADGEYELVVRDAIYRGREDFVYRVAVGELPFITQVFPLGGQAGAATMAAIEGWNLADHQLWLNTRPGPDAVRTAALRDSRTVSNEVTYAVDALPDCVEAEPNNDAQSAQHVELPLIVNGCIDPAGDEDVFVFDGRSGDEIVVEAVARRLGSPLDSLLRLSDASGQVLEWNDDHMLKDGHLHPDMGSLTHHADSHLVARLPADGTYYVRLADTQGHGGADFAYRLRIGPPQPDFSLSVAPSSLNMPAGRTVPLTVHALRKDGFGGSVEIVLKNAPPGFVLSGAAIPAGRDAVRMTLTAPPQAPDRPVALRLEGESEVGGRTVTRPVVPTEDMMQAFLWRHLTPAQEFLVAVRAVRWRPIPVGPAVPERVRVPAGGVAEVRVRTTRRPGLGNIELVPSEAADGLSIQNARIVEDGVAFRLKVEGKTAVTGFADNLIVEAFTEVTVKKETADGAPPTNEKRRIALGLLPAIPFVVVEP